MDNSVEKRDNWLISIIIPTYKRGIMLTEAINSVLQQSYQSYEIIIVDDCSPDDTEEIIKKQYANNSKVKYFKNKTNSGAGASRKNGYLKSKGKYLIFMDDDDYLTDNDFFKKAIEIFKSSDEELSFVSANSYIKYEATNEISLNQLNTCKKIDNKMYLEGFQTKYMKPNSTFTTIFNSQYIYGIENAEMLNDSSIYMRALLMKPAYILEDAVGVYRVHDKNMTFNLKLSFILDNLQEKKLIYDIIKAENILENAEQWLYRQIMLTADYYVCYSKPSKQDFDTLIEWCKKCNVQVSDKIIEELESHWTINSQKREKKKIE